MTVLNLTLTIPDNKVQELVDALNWQWKTNYTPAEIRDQIQEQLRDHLERSYRSHKRYLLTEQPIPNDLDIT